MKLAPFYSAPFKKMASLEVKQKLINAAFDSCYRGYFFITNEGYIGVCPLKTEPGDIIVFLYGGETPYVIRERDIEIDGSIQCCFEFIGECLSMDTWNL
jgi:hypothetical protein